MAPQKATAHEVFTVFENGGGYPSQGLSFFVGLIGTVFAMFGCDSAVHVGPSFIALTTLTTDQW